MKTKYIKFFLLAIGLTAFASCNKVLDLDPLTSYTEKTIFSDPKLTEAYITKHYGKLKPGWGGDWQGRNQQFSLRFLSDETMCNFNWNNNWGFNKGELNADNIMGGINTWFDYYANIRDINIVFQNTEVLNTLDAKTKNTLLGESHFFRAFYYMDLVNKFGGVPLILKPIALDGSGNNLPRNSYDECANFILDEFQKAADLLPLNQDGDNLGRATKGAALALKSRMALYMASPLWNPSNDQAKWQKAADAAWVVINLGSYSLDSSYRSLFLNPSSPEIIFEKLYNLEFGHYFDSTQVPNSWGGYSATCVSQDMVDSYEKADGTMYNQADYASTVTDPYAGRDPRFQASVVTDGSFVRGNSNNDVVEFWENPNGSSGGRDSRFGSEGWNASKTRYAIRKFTNESFTNIWGDKNTQPWVFSRLAEIYLNYAEAKFKLGDEATAKYYINLIRKRARGGVSGIVPDITASGAALWEKIQNERKIELAFEDHRFYDVRRWKIADVTENRPLRGMKIVKNANGTKSYSIIVVQPDRRFDASKHYLLPIPLSEIQKASNLKQNPGY